MLLDLLRRKRQGASSHHGAWLHTYWRSYLDLVLVARAYAFNWAPGCFYVLHLSICHETMQGLKPFSDSIALDPWLQQFPCSNGSLAATLLSHSSEVPWQPIKSHNDPHQSHNDPRHQSHDSTQWYYHNRWWVVPYISTHHTFLLHGFYLIFQPWLFLFPLLARNWWLRGGRTCWLVAMRIWMAAASMRMAAVVLHFLPPMQYAALVQLRALVWMVPWNYQLPTVLLEAFISVATATSLYLFYTPPPTPPTFLSQYILGTMLSCLFVLALSWIESLVMTFAPVDIEDGVMMELQPCSSSPWLAIRLASPWVWDVVRRIGLALLSVEGLTLIGYLLLLWQQPDWEALSWLHG